MKIGIIGLGAVGTAVKQGFEYIGNEVIGHDVKLNTKLNDILEQLMKPYQIYLVWVIMVLLQ